MQSYRIIFDVSKLQNIVNLYIIWLNEWQKLGDGIGRNTETYVAEYSYMEVDSTLVPEWQNKWQIPSIYVSAIN